MDEELRTCGFVRIGKHVSGIRNVLISAPAATASRSRTLFWAAAPADFVLALDPDDRKDQDGSHTVAWSAIQGWAQPPRRRKFNDGAHVSSLLVPLSA
jgi:hypothetical protein